MIFNNMNIKEKILSVLKSFFSNWKNVLLTILILVIIGMGISNRMAQRKIERLNAERAELVDTVSDYKNKVGDLYKARETYLTTIKDLKQLNEDLHAEVKNLKEHPIVVTKVEYETKVETIYIKDSLEVIDDEKSYKSIFNYSDRWTNIDGFTMFDFVNRNSYTLFNNITFTGNFYYDIIEKDKKLYTLVRSDNPYIQINNIESVILSPENSKIIKNHFRRPWGIMGGLGASVVLVNGTVKVYPAVQITIGYKFIDF